MGLTDGFVEISVPHIINSAPCTTHYQRASTKEPQICQGSGYGCLKGEGRHCNRPSCENTYISVKVEM